MTAPLDQRVEAYLREELVKRGALREHGGGMQGCEEVAEGSNAEVWRVDMERGAAIARFWKIESGRNRAEETVHLHRVLGRLALPCARLIDADLSAETAARFGFRVTLEEFVVGEHLWPSALARESVRSQLVAILLGLHAERSDVAGRPWREVNREHPWDRWVSHRFDVLLERVRTLRGPGEETTARIHRVLARLQPPVEELSPFHLIHGDVQPANYILTPGGRVVLIDLGTMCFGAFQRDLVLGEAAFGAEPGAFQPVLEDYFAQAPPERRALHRRHAPFFRAQENLRRTVSASRKAARPKYAGQRDALAARADRAWADLIATVETFGGTDS